MKGTTTTRSMEEPYPLILGASGLLGTEVTRQMATFIPSIRVTYREQSELNLLRYYGVEPFHADYCKPGSIAAAMKGVNRVICILPIEQDFEEWGRLAIDCAKEAGAHYIALSNFSVGKGSARISRHHQRLEEHLAASGLPYTIIRPSTYFQNLLWSTITIVRHGRFSLPMENAKIAHVDMRDVAEMIVAVMLSSGKHSGQTYTATGPETLSMFDIARLLSGAIGKTIRYYPAPLAEAEASFRDTGMTEWIASTVAEMYKDYATLDLTGVSADFKKVCGHAPRSFLSFVQEHARIFSGSP